MEGGCGEGGERLQSRWWRDLQNLEKESTGVTQDWFSNMVKKEVGSGSNTYF